jgi:hypothetical protein
MYGRRGEVRTEFWWGNLWEIYYLESLGGDGCIILKCILKKFDGDHGLN